MNEGLRSCGKHDCAYMGFGVEAIWALPFLCHGNFRAIYISVSEKSTGYCACTCMCLTGTHRALSLKLMHSSRALLWRMPLVVHAASHIAALGILLAAVALSLLLRARVLPSLPWEELAQPIPGTGGSVFLLDGFLSEAEVQHILAAGRQALGLTAPPAAATPQHARMYASTELQARDDPVLAALDERLANLTGIPVHSGEGTFRVAVSRPWLGAAAATDVEVQPLARDAPFCPPGELCNCAIRFRPLNDTPGAEPSPRHGRWSPGPRRHPPCIPQRRRVLRPSRCVAPPSLSPLHSMRVLCVCYACTMHTLPCKEP